MSEIKTFSFNKEGVKSIVDYKYGNNWPVVYLIENGNELYVGESIHVYSRAKQHLENEERKRLKNIHIISDDEYNKSATLDTESSLIEYLVADGKYTLQNSNGGLRNHEYFDREKYKAKFDVLWKKLQQKKITQQNLLQIRNSDIFKYSPYKTLTNDQYLIATKLLEEISDNKQQTYLINGGPGTGKTILATYLIKQLVENGKTEVALVIAMTALRKTLKKVFRNIPELNSGMVIGPNEVTNKKYDVLVVDETHRLRQRKNITNYKSFDETNKKFGFGNEGTELDWILKSANKVVLFFDEKQSVRPSDISSKKVKSTNSIIFQLKSQLRVKGGEKYLHFIDSLLEVGKVTKPNFSDYDFKIYDHLDEMISDIKEQEKEHQLSRIIAGYAWKWNSRKNKKIPDIVIGDTKLFWNSVTVDWVNSANAINEVGCIHTIQGYDLNYAGVIIGPEISFDKDKQEIVIDKDKYLDVNGKRSVWDKNELKRYIINIYKTLLTRGILGTYVYIVDDDLKDYFKSRIETKSSIDKSFVKKVKTPYLTNFETINLPMFESVGCGELLFADSIVQEMIPVRKDHISDGSKYFVLRTSGDSMNRAGINDGDLVLCRKDYHPEEGNNVVALIGDDATIKKYHRENGSVVLKPCSTNPTHRSLKFENNDEIKVLGVVVRVLDKNEI